MKKVLELFLALILVLSTFVACDKDDTPADDNQPNDNPPPAHQHIIVIDEAIPATCENAGLTSGAHCSECGEVLVKQEIISRLDHTVVIDEAVESTCYKTGLTSGAHCSECDEVLVKQETISKLDHTVVIDEAVESTCYKTGLTSGAHCSVCQAILVAQSEISPKTHTYDDKYDAFCNVCGHERDAECAHTDQATIVGKPATCTTEGITDGKKCAKCGELLVEQTVIDKLDHNEVIDVAVPPTCTETGLTEGSHCSECGEILMVQEIIPEAGHIHNTDAYGTCKNCGADMTSKGLNYSFIGDGTCSITGIGSCTDVDIIIPKCIDGYKVTSIAEHAFYDCDILTSIVIPDSVTSIGYNAFYECSNLTSITVEKGNPVYHSAGNCLIKTASKTLILGCNSSVIPDDGSVIRINNYAFYHCSSLTSIVIPDSVTTICMSAFSHCDNLTSIVIPNSVTSIYNWAFNYCSRLENITVERGNPVYHSAGNCIIETASKTLVVGCKNSVIPDDGSVTSIGYCAFNGCTSLTSIVIPDSVTSFDAYAFGWCSNLMSIVIPDSVTSIGNGAFDSCSSLTSVTIPDSVTNIDDHAFRDCCRLTSIVIPDSVTSIGDCAFYGCSSLPSIVIPDSVTSIGDLAFYRCSSLESIMVEQGNTVYHSAGNCLIETASKILIAGCKNSIIPTDGSVTSIGESAFEGCSTLKSIVIPDSVTSIGDSAFGRCSSLTSVVIPDSVTSIGEGAFEYCRSLTRITFEGTKAQWNAISKASGWDDNTGDYTIYCTDGNITK